MTRILPTTSGSTTGEQVVHLLSSNELEGGQADDADGPYLLVDLGALVRRVGQRDGGVVSQAAAEMAPEANDDGGGRGILGRLTVLGVTIGVGWAIRQARNRGREMDLDTGDRTDRVTSSRATEKTPGEAGGWGMGAKLPILLISTAVAAYMLRRRSSEASLEEESPSEATEGLAQRAAQTIQRRGEVVAERIETGTDSLAEQVETGGQSAAERMEETEGTIEDAEERAGEIRDEAEERADDVREDTDEETDDTEEE